MDQNVLKMSNALFEECFFDYKLLANKPTHLYQKAFV